MQNYNNGHVMDVSRIPVNDYETAAREWGEGSKSLEELLLYCLKNNIITHACCIGHKDTDMSYLQFELSERNINAIIKMINRYYNHNGIYMTFLNQPGIISKFDIRVPKNIGEQFFKDMLTLLSNGLNMERDSLPLEMKSTLDAMLKHRVPNEYLEIRYSKENNQQKMFVATTNPHYSDLYWNKKEARMWVENSISIEDSPENILPIINDISQKTSIVYSNYIDSQERYGNYQSSRQWTSNPSFSGSQEKETMSIVTNAQATRENDYAKQHRITVAEVLPGKSIEQVAHDICGKRYICYFNKFYIDSTKYTSPEQIVEAYKQHMKESTKKTSDPQNNQGQASQESQPKEEIKKDTEPKEVFAQERDKQRELDDITRKKQINAMQQANQPPQINQQIDTSEIIDDSKRSIKR